MSDLECSTCGRTTYWCNCSTRWVPTTPVSLHGCLPAGTVTDHGTIVGRSLTAYEMADGTYVAFITIHGAYPVASPLVVLR